MRPAAIQKALAERDVILANKKELEAETGISLDQLGDAQATAADQASCRSAGFMAGLFRQQLQSCPASSQRGRLRRDRQDGVSRCFRKSAGLSQARNSVHK